MAKRETWMPHKACCKCGLYAVPELVAALRVLLEHTNRNASGAIDLANALLEKYGKVGR